MSEKHPENENVIKKCKKMDNKIDNKQMDKLKGNKRRNE
jgi:hypothetical protein